MRPAVGSRTLLLAIFLLAAFAGGCASTGVPSAISIAPGRYADTFEAARESLIDHGFQLERVDARLGIITTRPKTTAGLASPWDQEQSTIAQEVEDLLNRHLRVAIVTFHLADDPQHRPARLQTVPGPEPSDLRLAQHEIIARVEVVLYRQQRPGWRLEPSAMRYSSRTMDPALRPAGMWPSYDVAFSQDRHLASRLEAQIRSALD